MKAQGAAKDPSGRLSFQPKPSLYGRFGNVRNIDRPMYNALITNIQAQR